MHGDWRNTTIYITLRLLGCMHVTVFLLWIFWLYVEKNMVLDMFQWKYACVDVIRTTNLATMTGKKNTEFIITK